MHRTTDVGGPLCYAEWPGAGPYLVVCVHGVATGHEVWTPVAPGLAAHGRVLAPDLPGFGRTPRAGRRTTPAGLQRVLSEFLAEVADRPAVVVASSLGAAVAVRQAVADPDSVAGLVLGSGYLPAYFGGWRAPGVVLGMLLERLGALGAGLRRRLLLSALGESTPTARETDEDSSVPRPERALSQLQALAPLAGMAVVPPLARRLYDAVRCPVLLLHGEADPVVPLAWAYAARQRRPDWTLGVLPAVSHVVELANPDWWLTAVTRWLEEKVPAPVT